MSFRSLVTVNLDVDILRIIQLTQNATLQNAEVHLRMNVLCSVMANLWRYING